MGGDDKKAEENPTAVRKPRFKKKEQTPEQQWGNITKRWQDELLFGALGVLEVPLA